MKLLNYLLSESKKGWKWPNNVLKAVAMEGGRGVNFYFDYTCPPSLSETLISPHPFTSAEVVTSQQYEAALAASKPEWDGEGLPPVGCECEGKQLAQLNWNKFKVVAIENGHVFGFWNDNVSTGLDSRLWEFRPIRSEADKKRENGVLSLAKAAGAMPFRYGETLSDGELLGSSWYELYDKIAAGEVTGIRID